MKKLASWSLVLAVAVLAVGTAAQAAVVTINLNFDKTTGIVIGEEVGWSMTVQVTQNSYNATINSVPHTYNAGLQFVTIGIGSTNAVGAFPTEVGSDPAQPAYGLYNTGTAPGAFPDPAAGLGYTSTYGPNGGITPQLLVGATKSGGYSSANYTTGQADLRPAYKIGVTEVVYAGSGLVNDWSSGEPEFGRWVATANGVTTLTPFVLSPSGRSDVYNMLVYTVSSTGAISQRLVSTDPAVDTVIINGATLTVGAVGPVNTAPTVSIVTAPVLQADWITPAGGTGWNSLGHFVDITALGVDDGLVGPLTYDWSISNGGAPVPLVVGGTENLHLTLQMLSDAGFTLPAYPGETWELSVVAKDGELFSAPATLDVFIPEPATMGLLAFGVIGLLKRRRRA